MADSPDTPLLSALDDADVLVAHASQNAAGAPQELVQNIIESRRAVLEALQAQQTPSSEQLSKFWQALSQLSRAVAPVTAQSIRESRGVNERRGLGRLFAREPMNAVFALLVFVLSLVLVGYAATGREAVKRVDDLQNERAQLIQKLDATKDERKRLEMRIGDLARRLGTDPDCPSPEAKDKSRGAREGFRLDKELEPLHAQCLALVQQDNELAVQHGQLRRDLKSRGELSKAYEPVLMSWLRQCPALICDPAWREDYLAEIRRLAQDGAGAAPAGAVTLRERLATLGEQTPQDLADRLATVEALYARQLVLRSQNLLGALGSYVIPMLMGMLGAFAYILRTITLQLRTQTYTASSMGMSLMRVCLGAVSGVFGAMLVADDPNLSPSLKSLPPLLLTFVFGYGIEIVFSVMDKLVSTLTTGEAPKPAKP